MFFLLAGVLAFLLVITLGLAAFDYRLALAVVASCLIFVPVIPWLLAAIPLLLLVIFLGQMQQAPRWWYARWTTAVLGGVLLIASANGAYHTYKKLQLRKAYPLQSLAPRLAYEQVRTGSTPPVQITPTDRIAQEARWTSLDTFVRNKSTRRSWGLEYLHRSAVRQFVNSAGFGVTRIGAMMEGFQRPLDPLPQLAAPRPDDDASPVEQPATASPARGELRDEDKPPIVSADLWGSHLEQLFGFINAEGFGYVREPQVVAGFQAHGFRAAHEPELKFDGVPHRLVRFELVSLLKHDEPRAYVSEHLPRMDELAEAPTRPLMAVERQLLSQLEAGEDVATAQQEGGIAMLGAIRATLTCQKCHRVGLGSLLGAFSYEFRPPRTAPLVAPTNEPIPPRL